ncbi:hypothetical protein GCM10023093_17820 [Nemorincola caseinilytica]|uniref:Uncharacterized protein n=1 Tax=Nemorincola caseinilytica TaxID=2054315 RepID=A0ABP8NGK3_9BACT
MEHKLQTQLHNFRYNSFIIKEPLTIEWFRYDLDEDLEENSTGFNAADLKLFQDYVVSNETNFGGPKNYFTVSSGEVPMEDVYEFSS